jgi:4'-phosphopantetheinyl transferase
VVSEKKKHLRNCGCFFISSICKPTNFTTIRLYQFYHHALFVLGVTFTSNSCMIQLLYYTINNRLPKERFDLLLQQLPIDLQQKIVKYRNWQDAERSLAGNILLLKALQLIGRNDYALDNLKYTEFQKPYFDETISFNISHSGEYVICAISETIQLGVDLEEIKEIPIEDFTNLFARQEWDEVIDGENKLQAFYTLWTKKEAFLKAVGCGLSQPLNEVVIENNRIDWENKTWFLQEIKLDADHIAYVCSDVKAPAVRMEEIYL